MNRRVVAVGEPNQSDFRDVVAWLSERSQLTVFPSSSDVSEQGSDLAEPDMILLLQSRPGQFARTDIERLHGRWPLARFITVLSSWCEGEARSGKPWPGTWRIYWYDLIRRLSPVFDAPQATPPSSWCLSRSASESDRLQSDLRETPKEQTGLAVIVARTRDSYETLADACRAVSLDPVWHRSNGTLPHWSATVGIWDSVPEQEGSREWERIHEFAGQICPAKLIVIQGFPRVEDYSAAQAAGVTVLAKPFQLPDLWRALQGTGTIGR